MKIAVIRNGFLQANKWPERLHTMQCIASNLSLFLVFTLYFVSLVKKVRVCYSLIAESCKMIHEMTNFLSTCRFYYANALMHISTWCMSLVGQWLFYSFFLFIRMSVHLSCMSIDNRYCYFNSVVCFVYRFKRVLKNHNSIVLYVVELLINSSLHFFLSFVLFEYLMALVSSLK